MLQLEREKNAQDRQVDTLKQQLHAETAKYAQLEKVASRQKAELIQLQDKNANFDREVNKLLTELKRSEWEVKQLESRQDKTIVEHVHVLEEAKRVTDRQLADAQKELESQAVYIRSLEKAKARLTNEVEDLARVTEKEHLVLRTNEKATRAQEALVKKAVLEAELERKNRQVSEANVRRLQEDLQATQKQVAEVTQQFLSMQQSKDELEVELARVADETNGSETLVKIQHQHQARIGQIKTELQRELADVKDRLKVEIAAKNEESSTSPRLSSFNSINVVYVSSSTDQRRQALARLSDLQVSSTAAQSELREAAEAFRTKADMYRAKLEAAEVEKVKASRVEAQSGSPIFL